MKLYRSLTGDFLGAFEDCAPDDITAIECEVMPTDGRQKWNGAAWIDTPNMIAQVAAENLAQTDAGMIRVIDDLINALDAAGVLPKANLPAAVVARLKTRADLRALVAVK